jgi:MFS family permease
LLGNTDFVRFWAGQAISSFGSKISREALPLTAVLLLGASPAQMGLLAASQSLPVLVFGLAAGVWVDRVRRRPLLIASDLGRALALLTIPVAAALRVLTIAQLYTVAVITGALTVFFDVAYQSYLPALVGRDHILEGNTRLETTSSVAEICGPVIGGALVQTVGGPVAVLIDAISFLCSALGLSLIRQKEPQPEVRPVTSKFREATLGLLTVARDPVLRGITAANTISTFFGGFFMALYSLYIVRALGYSPVALGFFIGMGGVGSLAGALLAMQIVRRAGLGRTIAFAFLAEAVISTGTPLAWDRGAISVALLITAQALGDLLGTVFVIGETSLRQMRVPDALLGRTNASVRLLVEGALPLGSLVGGVAAGVVGIREALAIAALGRVLASLPLLLAPLGSSQPVHE